MRPGAVCVVDEQVGGLHVAVHEPARVGGVERRAGLRHQLGRQPRLQRAVLVEHPAEVGAVDEAHRDEQEVAVVAGLVDRDHVRVVERRRDPRLALEPRAELLVARELRRRSASAPPRGRARADAPGTPRPCRRARPRPRSGSRRRSRRASSGPQDRHDARRARAAAHDLEREARHVEAVRRQGVEAREPLDLAVRKVGLVGGPEDALRAGSFACSACMWSGASQPQASIPITRTPRSNSQCVASAVTPGPRIM